jgi:hypothetical protein
MMEPEKLTLPNVTKSLEHWIDGSTSEWGKVEKPQLTHVQLQIIQALVRSKGGSFWVTPHELLESLFLTVNQDERGNLELRAPLATTNGGEDLSHVAEHIPIEASDLSNRITLFKRLISLKPFLENLKTLARKHNYTLTNITMELRSRGDRAPDLAQILNSLSLQERNDLEFFGEACRQTTLDEDQVLALL